MRWRTTPNDPLRYSYEQIEEISNFVQTKTKHRPKLAIICGSGLGHLANNVDEAETVPYEDIPNFPVSTVQGHAGKLVFGKIHGVTVVCMQGRFHVYEGYPLWKCAMPVRMMKLLGVNTLFVTNAAGGINSNFKVGDMMLIKDHINLPGFAGDNPLRGPNDERWGPRFPPMNNAYDPKLRKLAKDIGEQLGLKDIMHEGVYLMLGGPSFETVAEVRALKTLGADAVGMSTVHEVITAKHCGIRVFGMSLITNEAVMDYDTDAEPNHEEVLETTVRRKPDLTKFIMELVKQVGNQDKSG
ncbi:Purine nucleoside phosphorylase [Nymphon striatum]|nr:Purine nucleoside phosphorylase [Nymphon striatum]